MQLLSATTPTVHCALSVWPSGGHPAEKLWCYQFGDDIDRITSGSTHSPNRTHIRAVLRVQYSVQCTLQCLNCSSNVQITKHASSVSCSECLLVTAITFIDIMVFGLGLGLCLSNSQTLFLLVPHFRSLKLRIDFNIIFPSDPPSKFFKKMSHNSRNPFPSLPLSNHTNTICCQHTSPVT